MILVIECVLACLIFGAGIVGSVLWKKEMWLQDYAPEVQKRYLELHPGFAREKERKGSAGLIIGKIAVSLLFAAILSFMAYAAGARDFLTGALYSYIIWTVVNIFDVIVLDIWLFAKWKRIRLPGTENMDKEYASNGWKSIKDGFYGVAIGIPVACLCGLIIHVFC